MKDSDVKYSLIKNGTTTTTRILTETGTNPNRVLDSGVIKKGETNTYSLRIWIKEEAENDSIMNKIFVAKLRIEAEQKTETNNITVAYTYNSTSCVTGEESTCIETKCYENSASGSCPAGTIIKYAVNDTEEKYFHVLHDDGETMTLQQRENTVYNTDWYSSDDNTKGPLTILPVLETATSSWTNVNDQTYTMGTTVFKDNAYTGYNKSYDNVYTLDERTAKARMITYQEAAAVGCTSSRSCPIWMYNYLNGSVSAGGGTIDDITGGANNNGYWTMTAISGSTKVWAIYLYGGFNGLSPNSGHGARAVVVINK